MVANIPANVDVPLGLATRGSDAYVTIAHANETSLVRNDIVITTTGSGSQIAPCWATLDGPYLFTANTPSKSISRYVAYGTQLILDAEVAASLTDKPTDVAFSHGILAVVSSNGTVSRLSQFHVDSDGNLSLLGSSTVGASANGVAVVDFAY